ncbi:hypothetical protein MUO32_26105 [Shinella sp. CPCC 101442]|uniref:hypothetical protein n=1 Tax=Shinella sp. CPCC 101442 TaxID=2932265 RepID=UPI002152A432|nr:hypothetical protein [Shinella sp. CPCC 101442]MCR6502506.1 hypothetical protein [Shinella sp. CPCC 101442]
MQSRTDGEQKAQFFKSMGLKFNKCLSPEMSCTNAAIRAHSVQKSTALSFIEEHGHVCGLKLKVGNGEPVCEFEKVGRNNASTFTGFCNAHDTEIFLPVDTKPLDLGDAEQLFLIAYRSITRELHVVMESAVKLQTLHQTHVNLGVVKPNEPTASAAAPVNAMFKSWLVWRYRLMHYDMNLAKGRYREIAHSIFKISGRRAALASSSFFPTDENPHNKKAVRIALNMIPLSVDETAVIFSYPKVHSGPARKHIAPVMMKSGEDQLLALSTLALDTTENFFIRPSHVDSWSDEKKAFIQEAYFSTVKDGAFLKPHANLMLF